MRVDVCGDAEGALRDELADPRPGYAPQVQQVCCLLDSEKTDQDCGGRAFTLSFRTESKQHYVVVELHYIAFKESERLLLSCEKPPSAQNLRAH